MPEEGALIAIVDDDVVALEALAELIRAATGYRTSSFSNGRAFLSSLGEERPTAILLDLWMPLMDGMAVLRELRHRGFQQVPVIVMSAAGPVGMTGAVAAGATATLQKPVVFEDLLMTLNEVLESRKGDGEDTPFG